MPSIVETNVHRLESVSVFIFASWIIGISLSCAELIMGIVVGCRSRLSACFVGVLAVVSSNRKLFNLIIGGILVHPYSFCNIAGSLFATT